MTDSWTITLPRLPSPSLSPNRKRANFWAKTYAAEQDDKELAHGLALQAGKLPGMPWGAVEVDITLR